MMFKVLKFYFLISITLAVSLSLLIIVTSYATDAEKHFWNMPAPSIERYFWNMNATSDEISFCDYFIRRNRSFSHKKSLKSFVYEYKKSKEDLSYSGGPPVKNLREAVLKDLNIGFLVDRMAKTNLSIKSENVREYRNYIQKSILFDDPDISEFYVLMLMPRIPNKKLPVIISLHGHGDSNKMMKDKFFAEDFVRNGFVVALPSFKAMTRPVDDKISRKLCCNGFTLMGLRVYEVLLLIEYVKSQDFIDGDKIGIIGHSCGSTIARLIAIISFDLKSAIFDSGVDFLSWPIHCQTIPSLAYYAWQINDNNNLSFPIKEFRYGYKKENDIDEIIKFFKEHLMGKAKRETAQPLKLQKEIFFKKLLKFFLPIKRILSVPRSKEAPLLLIGVNSR